MRLSFRSRPTLALAALLTLTSGLALSACSDDEGTPTGSTSSSSGTTTSSSSGGGGDTTTSTTTSTTSSSSGGGAGGGTTEPVEGAPGSDLVNAGTVMNSPNHRLVFSLGQSSPLQHKAQSPSYQVRGGLTGATE
jgi:hypothetical protein